MPRPRVEGICCIEGCGETIKAKSWCKYHYQKFYKTDPTYTPIDNSRDWNARSHPFYHLWFERRSFNLLCDEWLDFPAFVKGVEPKPEGNYFLVRLRDAPFSPNNFKWAEHLKRKEGESKSDWWARKRAARILANPSLESDRNIKRVFGLTREDYNEILKSQNHSCAICNKSETAVDGKTGTIKKLAVDHCHNSLKIRGLLCWRCNTVIGRAEDDVKLLQNMINYLNKHKGDENG